MQCSLWWYSIGGASATWLGVSSECVKRIFQDQFLQKWFSRISEEETFSTYSIYKDIHEFKECIDILPEYLKYSLFDFRTGSQKLSVNRRSDLSIPRQDRICTKCRKRILGDEFHFLFECSGIGKLRLSTMPKYHRIRCSTLKLHLNANHVAHFATIRTRRIIYVIWGNNFSVWGFNPDTVIPYQCKS